MGRHVWCKHYRGMHERDACEAGVRFASLPGRGEQGFFTTCPCFGPRGGCDRAEYPTEEELAAEEAADEKRWQDISTARRAIEQHLGGPWKQGTPGAKGAIDCPVCSGEESLAFSRSGYNGHIHAGCGTPGCVKWME